MSSAISARRVEAVRRFSRFYTHKIGVLRDSYLDSPFNVTQSRVVFEIAHRERTTASELSRELGLDPGYLSRTLKGFERDGYIARTASEIDGRQRTISLTDRGAEAFARLNEGSRRQVRGMLDDLTETEQIRLIAALETVEDLLGETPLSRVPYILRPHQAGDIGWVIQAHGALYAREYGWDESFEAMVAEIAANFLQNFDPAKERCWIAEMDGENVGSAFVVRAEGESGEGGEGTKAAEVAEVAKLRLVIVDPKARGLGIGARLVEESIRFARAKGYRELTLWTNDVLHAARHIYQAAGFRLIDNEPYHGFGHDLVGETWTLALRD